MNQKSPGPPVTSTVVSSVSGKELDTFLSGQDEINAGIWPELFSGYWKASNGILKLSVETDSTCSRMPLSILIEGF